MKTIRILLICLIITLILGTEPIFAESVGGITLDMSKQEVLNAYGKPTRVLSNHEAVKLCGANLSGAWYYKNDGWIVSFDGNEVDRIIILRNGNRSLDSNGLNCYSSKSDFANIYGVSHVGDILYIGNGENLVFFDWPNSLALTIYNT